MPARARRSDDFPDPFGPRTWAMLPGSRARLMPENRSCPGATAGEIGSLEAHFAEIPEAET